jgi:hypothetical protein
MLIFVYLFDHSYILALLVQDVNVLASKRNDRIDHGMLLCLETLELVVFNLLLKVIIH